VKSILYAYFSLAILLVGSSHVALAQLTIPRIVPRPVIEAPLVVPSEIEFGGLTSRSASVIKAAKSPSRSALEKLIANYGSTVTASSGSVSDHFVDVVLETAVRNFTLHGALNAQMLKSADLLTRLDTLRTTLGPADPAYIHIYDEVYPRLMRMFAAQLYGATLRRLIAAAADGERFLDPLAMRPWPTELEEEYLSAIRTQIAGSSAHATTLRRDINTAIIEIQESPSRLRVDAALAPQQRLWNLSLLRNRAFDPAEIKAVNDLLASLGSPVANQYSETDPNSELERWRRLQGRSTALHDADLIRQLDLSPTIFEAMAALAYPTIDETHWFESEKRQSPVVLSPLRTLNLEFARSTADNRATAKVRPGAVYARKTHEGFESLELKYLQLPSQGDSVVMRFGHDTTYVIDTGLRSDAAATLNSLLSTNKEGPLTINLLITHRDLDHLGGLRSIVSSKALRVEEVVVAFGPGEGTQSWREADALLRQMNYSREVLANVVVYRIAGKERDTGIFRSGSLTQAQGIKAWKLRTPLLGSATVFQIEAPQSENSASLIVKVTHRGLSHLMTGDATLDVIQRLNAYEASRPGSLRASFLKWPHHLWTPNQLQGSAGELMGSFLRQVQPNIIVLSNSGKGQPDESVGVIRNFARTHLGTGVEVVWTKTQGDALFITSRDRLERGGARTQHSASARSSTTRGVAPREAVLRWILLPVENQDLRELQTFPVCTLVGDGQDSSIWRHGAHGDAHRFAVSFFLRLDGQCIDAHSVQRVVASRTCHRIVPPVILVGVTHLHLLALGIKARPGDQNPCRRDLVYPDLALPPRTRHEFRSLHI